MADTSTRRRRGSSSSRPSGSSSSRPSSSRPSGSGESSKMGFLGKKIGPVPIWLIGLGIFGIYYWYTHYGPGAQKQQAAQKKGQGQGRGRGGGTRVIVIRDGGGRGRGRGRRHNHKSKQSPRASSAPGGNVGGGMTAEATAPYQTATAPPPGPTGGAVDDTGAPVYQAYQQFYGAQGGDGESAVVPDPVQAYAPMTAGAIYAGPDYG